MVVGYDPNFFDDPITELHDHPENNLFGSSLLSEQGKRFLRKISLSVLSSSQEKSSTFDGLSKDYL